MPSGIYPTNTKHGHARRHKRTRTYSSWAQMKSRCFEPGATRYDRYGGRGITVCERWVDFENFLADMGECPSGLSIERRNNDGNYSCGKCEQCVRAGWELNCYWATVKQQSNNTSKTVFLEYNGERKSLNYWAEEFKISPKTLRSRLELGWEIHKALTEPLPSPTQCRHGHEYTPENTRFQMVRGKYQTRICRECDRLGQIEIRKQARLKRESANVSK